MRWSRWLIVATAATCLVQGIAQLGGPRALAAATPAKQQTGQNMEAAAPAPGAKARSAS